MFEVSRLGKMCLNSLRLQFQSKIMTMLLFGIYTNILSKKLNKK